MRLAAALKLGQTIPEARAEGAPAALCRRHPALLCCRHRPPHVPGLTLAAALSCVKQEPQYVSSKILSGLQQLSVADGAKLMGSPEPSGRSAAELCADAAAAERVGNPSASADAPPPNGDDAAAGSADGDEEGDGEDEEDGGEGWEMACSRSARVRRMKKTTKKAAWEARRAQEARSTA